MNILRKTIYIVTEKGHEPAVLGPLMAWLKLKNDVVQCTPEGEQSEKHVRLWALKDDKFGCYTQRKGPLDYAISATAPDGFGVIHPAVSISKMNSLLATDEFENCFWMVNSQKAKEVAVCIGVSEAKIIMLELYDQRIAYHLALCLVVPEVFTLREAAKELLEKTGIGRAWDIVRQTSQRTSSNHVDQHYHGPAARGDRGTLEKHFSLLSTKLPCLAPLYSELIQYRIAKGLISRGKYDDLGIGKYYWDTECSCLNGGSGDSFISDDDAKSILSEIKRLLTCAPLVISITFFKLELGVGDEPLTVNLSGKVFALHWCQEIYTEFKKQVQYFLNESGHNGISTRVANALIDNVKPYLVVSREYKEVFDKATDYFTVLDSGLEINNSTTISHTHEPSFEPIVFERNETKQTDHRDHCQCDGWYPVRFNGVVELVIPLFRFKSTDGKPLLEGLVTVVCEIGELARVTPSRVSDIQSFSLRKYLATGYLERRIIDLGRKEAEADSFKKIKDNLGRIRALRKPLMDMGLELESIESVLNPFRLLRGTEVLGTFITGQSKKFGGGKHDAENWEENDIKSLKVDWKSTIYSQIKKELDADGSGTYKKYFGCFDSTDEDKAPVYILKAVKDGKCPLIWLKNSAPNDKNASQGCTAILLDDGVPPLAWALAVNEMNGKVTRVDEKSVKVSIDIIFDGQGTLDKLKESVTNLEKQVVADLTSKHTSGILALLKRAAKINEIEHIPDDTTCRWVFTYTSDEVK